MADGVEDLKNLILDQIQELRREDRELIGLERQRVDEQYRAANAAEKARSAAERTESWTMNILDQATKINEAVPGVFDEQARIINLITTLLSQQPLGSSVDELANEVRESNERIEQSLYLMFQVIRFVLTYIPARKDDKEIIVKFLEEIDRVEPTGPMVSKESLQRQLMIHNQALLKLREQEAKMGGLPDVTTQLRIEEVERNIERVQSQLNSLKE